MPTQIDINVGVFNTPEGPTIFVEPGKDKVSAGKAGDPAVHIEWNLAGGDADWALVSIEFDAAGQAEFEDSQFTANGKKIKIKDKLTTVGEFKYTIWCAPKNGFGKPISLDPIIRNEPPL